MNHFSSAMSEAQLKGPLPKTTQSVGDLVYLYSDRNETKARPRYIVVAKNDDWCHIKRLSGANCDQTPIKSI